MANVDQLVSGITVPVTLKQCMLPVIPFHFVTLRYGTVQLRAPLLQYSWWSCEADEAATLIHNFTGFMFFTWGAEFFYWKDFESHQKWTRDLTLQCNNHLWPSHQHVFLFATVDQRQSSPTNWNSTPIVVKRTAVGHIESIIEYSTLHCAVFRPHQPDNSPAVVVSLCLCAIESPSYSIHGPVSRRRKLGNWQL